MLTFVRCTECGKSGQFPYSFSWTPKYEYCKTCGKDESTTKHYQFCSEKCLSKFMKKFIGHKHIWGPHQIKGVIENLKTKEKRVWRICEICDLEIMKKATKAEIKEANAEMAKWETKTDE